VVDATRLGPPIDLRPLLPALRAELRDLLNDLTPQQWSLATTPGWTVFDTVANLVGGDLRRLSRTRDGQSAQDPVADESVEDYVDRTNEEWATAMHQVSSRVLVELLETFGPRTIALFAGMELDAAGEHIPWAGPGPAPAWLDIAREYTERWIHQQQIRRAVEAPLLDDPRFLGPVVETFVRSLPATMDAVARPESTAVVFEVTGDAGGTWVVERGAEHWRLTPAARTAEAAATVSVAPTVVWQVGTRLIAPDAALAKASVTGDVELAARALSLLAILRVS
jgi:uncharacterized protein (TIGR03083 family)